MIYHHMWLKITGPGMAEAVIIIYTMIIMTNKAVFILDSVTNYYRLDSL